MTAIRLNQGCFRLLTVVSFAAMLAACSSRQINEDYFEPSGSGRPAPRRGVQSGPVTELLISAPHMRSIAIAGWPTVAGSSQPGVTVCIWLEPQDGVAVDVPIDLIRTFDKSDGLLVPFERPSGTSHYHPPWDYSDYWISAPIPGRVFGATKPSPRALLPERRLQHKYCAALLAQSERFVVRFGSLVINGAEFSIPPVQFDRRRGVFTYGLSPS